MKLLCFILTSLLTVPITALVVKRSSKSPSTRLSATSSASTDASVLIDAARHFVENQSAFYSPADPSVYAEEFVFRGPIIGPLNKRDYLYTLGECFKLYESFPDLSPNPYGFTVDPENPRKVWFWVRNTGTFQKDLKLLPGIVIPANGRTVDGAPETFSILFDDDQKVRALTVGYVADRFLGNTAGYGAAFGLLQAVGVNLPSTGNPLVRFFNFVADRLDIDGLPRSYSRKEDIPEWWKHKEVNADPRT